MIQVNTLSAKMAQLCVILPLYIYPLDKAWEPLIRAAKAHPNVRFIAIVNPGNGPGADTMPDANYRAALRELSLVCNILPVGYVHCTYGQRDLEAIRRDVDIYRQWNSEFRMEGIFIDEVPSGPEHVPYMASLSNHVHITWQAGLDRSGVVIYNPGVVIDRAFFGNADYVVTFEQSQSHWSALHAECQDAAKLPSDLHSKALVIMHTCSTAGGGLESIVREVRKQGFAGLYITEQEGGNFTQWPSTWDLFVRTLAEDA